MTTGTCPATVCGARPAAQPAATITDRPTFTEMRIHRAREQPLIPKRNLHLFHRSESDRPTGPLGDIRLLLRRPPSIAQGMRYDIRDLLDSEENSPIPGLSSRSERPDGALSLTNTLTMTLIAMA